MPPNTSTTPPNRGSILAAIGAKRHPLKMPNMQSKNPATICHLKRFDVCSITTGRIGSGAVGIDCGGIVPA
jgi:hypothetical protein